MASRARAPDGAALTRWFPGDVRPARRGVYQLRCGKFRPYALWTGGAWLYPYPTPAQAAKAATVTRHQHWPWRGLAEKPGNG